MKVRLNISLMNMTQKNKKNIWITGGGTGIGRELVKLFSDKNYNVIVSGRRLSKLNEIKNYNKKNIFVMKLDVSDSKACKKASSVILKKFGFLDIIILNAAAYSPGALTKLNINEIKKIIETNILGPINCFAPILEIMKKEKRGHLIFVSSPSGFRGLPGAGIYGVTKSALTFLAETLKLEYDQFKIKVQVIHPGFIKTPMTDKNTFPMPFIISAQKAANIIIKQIFSERFEIYFPRKLIIPMKIMRILPTSIYFFLMKKFVKKMLDG